MSELKIEVGKFYKTKDGEKAFVFFTMSVIYLYVVVGSIEIQCATRRDDCITNLVEEWKD